MKPIGSQGGGPEVRLSKLEAKDRIRDAVYTVATAPNPTTASVKIIYVTNGAAGDPIPAYAKGSDWLRFDTHTPISET